VDILADTMRGGLLRFSYSMCLNLEQIVSLLLDKIRRRQMLLPIRHATNVLKRVLSFIHKDGCV
jgi:hypothetical protein